MNALQTSNQDLELNKLLRQGMVCLQKGYYQEARAAYEKILTQHSNNFEALHFLSIVAYQEKDYQLATKLIIKAIALYPNNAALYSTYGIMLKAQKNLGAAIKSYNKSISIKPDYT